MVPDAWDDVGELRSSKGIVNPQKEWPLVREAASRYGVNPYFIMGIRHAEGGRPGRDFGVLSVPAPTYADQLRVACLTVARRLTEYRGVVYKRVGRVAVYSDEFAEWFGKLWAPDAAENDPHGLNANWSANVLRYQRQTAEMFHG
jgi:hypothetical protein